MYFDLMFLIIFSVGFFGIKIGVVRAARGWFSWLYPDYKLQRREVAVYGRDGAGSGAREGII